VFKGFIKAALQHKLDSVRAPLLSAVSR